MDVPIEETRTHPDQLESADVEPLDDADLDAIRSRSRDGEAFMPVYYGAADRKTTRFWIYCAQRDREQLLAEHDRLAGDRDIARNEAGRLTGELVRAEQRITELTTVSRGYCPECGRGDAAPSVEDWEREHRRAEQAEALCGRLTAEADRLRAAFEQAWAERNAARGRFLAAVGRLPIEELGITPRTHGVLTRSHRSIRFIGQLLELTEEDVTDLRNSGVKTLEDIKERLRDEFGLTLADGSGRATMSGMSDSTRELPGHPGKSAERPDYLDQPPREVTPEYIATYRLDHCGNCRDAEFYGHKALHASHVPVIEDGHGPLAGQPCACKTCVIPERERLVHDDPELAAQIREGVAEAERGETHDLGSFAQYLDDSDDDA